MNNEIYYQLYLLKKVPSKLLMKNKKTHILILK